MAATLAARSAPGFIDAVVVVVTKEVVDAKTARASLPEALPKATSLA